MSRVCQITGVRPKSGGRIHRSGLAKKKGGIGRHVTKVVKRWIYPNTQKKRIWVPELGEWVKVTATCRALKTINKNGAYATLLKAGLIQPVKRTKKIAEVPVAAVATPVVPAANAPKARAKAPKPSSAKKN
jgi:large subunit ribosomal protein L28